MIRRVIAVIAAVVVLCMPVRTWAEEDWVDGSVVHVKTEARVVALTFDDGPHPRYTARILKVLEKYDVKATFFMIGQNVERYPDVARAVSLAHHEIGNHTMHHTSLAGKSEEEIRTEVAESEDVIMTTTRVKPLLFRAPMGVRGEILYHTLEKMGYRQILWNTDTLDWQGRGSGAIAAAVTRGVKGGDIILCHDYVSGKLQADAALDIIIPALLSRGFQFVTVSELLTMGEVITPHF